MAGRLARADEVETWRHDGWVLLDDVVAAEDIDLAVADLPLVFPTAADYHADPDGERERWLGRPAPYREVYTWPPTGPGFRPEQHRWQAQFPFPGSGALNRLAVHPGVVDFCARALGTDDLRIYQVQMSAKYTGETNYEQPMHTDRNHSWLPSPAGMPWWHVEGFLYLSDVHPGTAPTHLVPVGDAAGRHTTDPLILPTWDEEIYTLERPAAGRRGSLLAYRSDVFHRAVDLTEPGGARFLLNVSFKLASCEWVGYHALQSRATSPDWATFVAGSTPRELALFGFPPPGDPVWDMTMLDATAERYPGLDLEPWRQAMP
jgi:hypothetical protein